MRTQKRFLSVIRHAATTACLLCMLAVSLSGQQVTYQPYIQPGDSSGFGPTDQMVIAWQTNEPSPNLSANSVEWATNPEFKHATSVHPHGRTVDNY